LGRPLPAQPRFSTRPGTEVLAARRRGEAHLGPGLPRERIGHAGRRARRVGALGIPRPGLSPQWIPGLVLDLLAGAGGHHEVTHGRPGADVGGVTAARFLAEVARERRRAGFDCEARERACAAEVQAQLADRGPRHRLDGPDVNDEDERHPQSGGQSIPSEERKSSGTSYQRGRRFRGVMHGR